MQLRRALRKRAHEREVRAVRFGPRRLGAMRILQKAPQIVDGVVPAVALIHDEGLQQADGGGLRSRALIFDHARHRCDVGEMRHLGEKTADLGFRIHARPQAPIELEKEPLPQRSAVLLPCVSGAPAARSAPGSPRSSL